MLYQYCGWLQKPVKLFHAFHNALHLHYKAARTVTEREFLFLYAIIDSKSYFSRIVVFGFDKIKSLLYFYFSSFSSRNFYHVLEGADVCVFWSNPMDETGKP